MARQHARFCGTRCRSKAHRAKKNGLPDELTTRDRWVRRSTTKVPLTTGGMPASSTDPRTWSSHKSAAASTAGVGLGFVLSDEDDIVCIDLDHCLNPLTGRLAPWAAAIVRDAGTTYVEVSPSGDGLHIWGRADVRQGRRIRRGAEHIEIYGHGRFIAVTGRRFGHCPSVLADLSALVARLTTR
ncbi:bifunctional DNA primase/polymerase [Streptomyces hydrogenans]|uniref:bifunctional DNA primase/polymerase n=1 Tax=Streptomyces hydrogenans TaxID=1873719 RepID=UPI0035DD21C8